MSGRPQVCRFYKQGNCQYGNNCRFYHPNEVKNHQSNNMYNNNNNNPFGGRNYSSNNFNNGSSFLGAFDKQSSLTEGDIQQFCNPSTISQRETEIRNDMNELSDALQASQNIFTSYSLKPPASVNLIANRDLSFEEMRTEYYKAQNMNSLPLHEQQLINRHNDMKSCITFLRNNTQKAVRYLQLALQNTNTTPKPLIPPFDSNAQTNSVTESSNNTFATATLNPFGNAASSQSSSGSTGINNPFGGVGGTLGSFGVASNNAKSNPFGGASDSVTPSNPFGSSSTPAGAFGSGGFGSTLKPKEGAFASQASPFGNSSVANNTSTFGSSGFGSSGFGSSGFGSTGFGSSGFGSATEVTSMTLNNPFGSSSKVSNPFGGNTTKLPTTVATNPVAPGNFDERKSFGNTGFGSSGFGNSSINSPFGNSVFNEQNNSGNPFGGQSASQSTNVGNGNFAFNGNSFGSNNQTSSFDGLGMSSHPVEFYKQGGIDDSPTKLEALGEEIIEIFKSEQFELGKVPDVPPPLEFC